MASNLVKPLDYPNWVKAFAVTVLLAATYSFYLAPSYLQAYKTLRQADKAYYEQRFDDSIDAYKKILRVVPDSKPARVNIALAHFSKNTPLDDEYALAYLEGVKLDKYDWAKLIQVMPGKYQEVFKETKE